MVSLSVYNGEDVYFFDFNHIGYDVVEKLNYLWLDPSVKKVFHNASFDVKFLFHYGAKFGNIHCTYIAESILKAGFNSLSMSLEAVCERRLGVKLNKSIRETFAFGGELTRDQIEYAVNDVIVLKEIFRQQEKELIEQNLKKVYDFECSIILPTVFMEYYGIRVDLERLKQAEKPFKDVIQKTEQILQDIFIENGIAEEIVFSKEGYVSYKVSSPQQMLEALQKLGIDVKSMNAKELALYDAQYGGRYVDETEEDEDNLLFSHIGVSHPILRVYAASSIARKVYSTYIQGLGNHAINGRIYPSFLQLGARATGRYSSKNPNFQNIVKKERLAQIGLEDWDIRSMFIADENCSFVICDYSGIELVIAGLFSQDETMLHLIEQGDIHSYVASNIFGVDVNQENRKKQPFSTFRDCAKTITYARMYGSSGRNLEMSTKNRLSSVGYRVMTGEGDKWIRIWDEIFPKAGRFLQESAKNAVTKGYVETIIGRKRYWNTQFPSKRAYFAAMREGSNAPIQGSSADMIKLAIRMIYERLRYPQERIVATIHDELIVSCPDENVNTVSRIVQNCMEEAGRYLFPLSRKFDVIKAEPKITKRYDK
jgi:DNA polymerase-1